MRTVKVVSGQFDPYKAIESDATTWGALKSDFSDNGIDYLDRRVVLSQGKVDLVSDDAALPEGEVHIFIYAEKVKSGSAPTTGELMERAYNELRSLGSNLGLNVHGSKKDIAKRLSKYYRGQDGASLPSKTNSKVGKRTKTKKTASENSRAEAVAASEDLKNQISELNSKIDRVLEIISENQLVPEASSEISDEDAQMLEEFNRTRG
jgi:hypothetical protein